MARRGEAASEAVSDEATLARHAQTDCGVDDLLGQALTRENMAAAWNTASRPTREVPASHLAPSEAADLAALAPQKRGPKVDPNRSDALHSAGVTAAEPPTTL